jgi:hypothetical protein
MSRGEFFGAKGWGLPRKRKYRKNNGMKKFLAPKEGEIPPKTMIHKKKNDIYIPIRRKG